MSQSTGADIRVDPLTGVRSLHVGLAGKPAPRTARILANPDVCPFCAITQFPTGATPTGAPVTGDTVTDGTGDTRTVLACNDTALVVANRWNVLDGIGDNDLLITREHALGLEDLTSSQARDFGQLLWERTTASTRRRAAGIVNVGVNAGGSVAHLHGQVIAADVDAVDCPRTARRRGRCPVCTDVNRAGQAGLLIRVQRTTVTYLPAAPSTNLEFRIAVHACTPAGPEAGGQLLAAARDLLVATRDTGFDWPYNLRLHAGAHPHVHVHARVDAGIVYPAELALVPITTNLADLAALLTR